MARPWPVVSNHEDIVSEYPGTEAGVPRRGHIKFALDFIRQGRLEATTKAIHARVFNLLRLLVADHPFVDANKRTALNATTVFHPRNSYRFTYDDGSRSILERLATDEASVAVDTLATYLESHTEPLGLAGDIEAWWEDLGRYGLDQLPGDREDPNN